MQMSKGLLDVALQVQSIIVLNLLPGLRDIKNYLRVKSPATTDHLFELLAILCQQLARLVFGLATAFLGAFPGTRSSSLDTILLSKLLECRIYLLFGRLVLLDDVPLKGCLYFD